MTLTSFICTACGTEYTPSETPPPACLICDDERQYVPTSGQGWTTLERLQRSHMPTFRDEHGLLGIGMSPGFAIGQRALLVRTPDGNILWDCISLVSDVTVELIRGIGGLKAIAISHPHYYTTMVAWSRAFGGIPVHLHAADREWVMRPDDCIAFWDGDTKEIAPGITLIRAGGHYPGGTVLHWAAGGPDGGGALLSGDILQVVADRKHLGFMRSYPNFIPLGAAAVRAIRDRVAPYRFGSVYGAFWNAVVAQDGKAQVEKSVDRHIAWLERPAD
jgi:glyoxylase-like metal-dependent hydrolase (beta-lactamase superfamily II)